MTQYVEYFPFMYMPVIYNRCDTYILHNNDPKSEIELIFPNADGILHLFWGCAASLWLKTCFNKIIETLITVSFIQYIGWTMTACNSKYVEHKSALIEHTYLAFYSRMFPSSQCYRILRSWLFWMRAMGVINTSGSMRAV